MRGTRKPIPLTMPTEETITQPPREGVAKVPLIEALVKSLPAETEAWPIEKQAGWLRTAAAAFSLIYPYEGESSIEIKIVREAPKQFIFPPAPKTEL
jgi:hypothetical protein